MLSSVRHPVILSFIVFFFNIASGQKTEFSVTHYDETTGLQSNVINAMMQDSRGYFWFGTADGLFRYDGYNFKIFRKISGEPNSLPGNSVVKLAEDHNGKIWIGFLKDGISCYDPATGIFKNYSVKNVDSATPLARSVTMLFIDRQNNVWAGLFQKGLIKLDKSTGQLSQYNVIADTNTYYSKEFREVYNFVNAMCEEGNGIFWLATRDGLYRFNSRTAEMQPVRAAPLQKNVSRDDLFTSLAADKNGLWLSSWAGGLSYFDFKTKKWNNYKFDFHHTNVATINIILDLKWKNENELWIATSDRGFGSFNTITHRFTFFSSDAGSHAVIPGKYCFGVMQDKQNNIWLSHANGLSKVRQTEKRFIYVPVRVSRSDNGPFYEISSMLEDKAGKYFLTGTSFADGLHITNKLTKETKILSFDVKPNEESILMVNDIMQDSKGIIWVLTRDNVYQFDQVKCKLISLPQPPGYMDGIRSNSFTAIREDKKGKIWIASGRNGVFCYDPQTKIYEHFYSGTGSRSRLRSNVISGIAIDRK
ncbi:MAG TPA: two-component regulator propeller domain-containing protein, partial [Segetibacter sp.]